MPLLVGITFAIFVVTKRDMFHVVINVSCIHLEQNRCFIHFINRIWLCLECRKDQIQVVIKCRSIDLQLIPYTMPSSYHLMHCYDRKTSYWSHFTHSSCSPFFFGKVFVKGIRFKYSNIVTISQTEWKK